MCVYIYIYIYIIYILYIYQIKLSQSATKLVNRLFYFIMCIIVYSIHSEIKRDAHSEREEVSICVCVGGGG